MTELTPGEDATLARLAGGAGVPLLVAETLVRHRRLGDPATWDDATVNWVGSQLGALVRERAVLQKAVLRLALAGVPGWVLQNVVQDAVAQAPAVKDRTEGEARRKLNAAWNEFAGRAPGSNEETPA
jgi:phage gp46-like protein